MAQTTNRKAPLVPNLRFPDFAGDGEWEKSNISSIATFHKGKGISKADIAYDGKQPCIRYGEIYTIYAEVIFSAMSKTNLSASKLFLSKINDVIIPASGETKIDIATAACVMKDNIALGGDLNIVRTSQNGIFLSYYINGRLKKELAQKAQGDTVVHLYASQIAMLTIAITSSSEQQRIADCLTSIDESITAESQKLEALTAHKKALMQKLFPSDGEKVPALRFKEFEGAGEWEEMILDDLVHCQDGFAFKSTEFVKSRKNTTQVVRITEINNKNLNQEHVYIQSEFIKTNNLKKYTVNDGDLLLSLTGAAGFNFFFWDSGPAIINQRTLKITPRDVSSCSLLRLLEPLLHDKINARGEGQNNNLSKEFLSSIVLHVPKENEQLAIANFLENFDELIVLQARKIQLLKEHKIGLMQQLFPVFNYNGDVE